ncbi:WD40-repeat-containing domain protein [Trametes gibbosa]|nr:WD40-repeat-containing domain protein [Trametes gibbosa]
MDVRHSHGTEVHVVRACYEDDAADLIAVGGAHSVEILLLTETSCKTIANFHIGSRVTALAWSSRVSSPSSTDSWSIELAAAGADFSLYLLSKSSSEQEEIFPFGGGLSGHHGKVNDMTFCGGRSEDSSRYVATVSDDKMLMVWDLHPSIDLTSPPSPGASPPSRPQPTAYVITFPHPLTSVNAHPSTSKELLVADCRGSVFLTDWRSDPDENEQHSWRNSSVVELLEPRALADSLAGPSAKWSGSVAWRRDPSAEFVGAAYGSRFALWDMGSLSGGKPYVTGTSFAEGGSQFRWCPTYADYFAVSTSSAAKGAVIHVHNVAYVHAQPTVFQIAPRPLYVRAFDFVACRGIPRIVAAVGREVIVFYIGVDS